MKNIYTWARAVSIDKKNLIRMLDNGYSPVICPGGVQEVLLMESTDECKMMIMMMMMKMMIMMMIMIMIMMKYLNNIFDCSKNFRFNTSQSILGVLYLKCRFGFIKLALEYGIPLVPVFSFGIDKIYNFWCPKGKLINNIARQIGFLPVLIFGLFNLPFGNIYAYYVLLIYVLFYDNISIILIFLIFTYIDIVITT